MRPPAAGVLLAALASALAGCAGEPMAWEVPDDPPGAAATAASPPRGPGAVAGATVTVLPGPDASFLPLRHLTPCMTFASEARYDAFRTPEAYGAAWRDACGDEAAPPVDFANETLLLASWGPQPTAAHTLRIVQAALEERHVILRVVRITPGDGCSGEAPRGAAADLAATERLPESAAVFFVFEDMAVRCSR